MSVTEMTERLQFRSQAMAFVSSSGKKPFTVKEVGYNFKTIGKPKKNLWLKATPCALGVEVSHTLVEPYKR